MLADPGGGAGAAFAGMGAAIGGIVEAANNGGFGISENGGQALIDAIDDLMAAVGKALANATALGKEPALGTTPAATVYKPFLATIASDPVQGAIPMLTKLHEDLVNARAAIQKAMQNFRDNEHTITSSVKTIPT